MEEDDKHNEHDRSPSISSADSENYSYDPKDQYVEGESPEGFKPIKNNQRTPIKKVLSTFFLRKLIYIIFFCAFFYNLWWIIFMYKTKDSDIECSKYENILNKISKYLIFNIAVSFIVIIPRILCRSESDCNMLFIALKQVLSWVLAVFIYIKFYKKKYAKDMDKLKSFCSNTFFFLDSFFNWEIRFVNSGFFLLGVGLVGLAVAIFVEICKGIGYARA